MLRSTASAPRRFPIADKPRVLVVGPFPPTTGGVTTFMLNLIGSSQKEEWEFVRHSTSRPLRKRAISGEVSYAGFLEGGIVRALTSLAITAWHAVTYPVLLLRSGARIAQIQSSDYFAFWEASLYVVMTRAMGRTAVIRFGGGVFDTFYEGSSARIQSLIRRVLDAANGVVVQSQRAHDYFARLTDPSKLRIIPNAVPSPPLPPERDEAASPVTAVFICNTEPVAKGIDEVLSMAPRLRGRVRIRCIATPDEVRQRITELGLGEVVEPVGTIDRVALDIEYRRADMFLIPSHGEGFPNSMLEAMAMALPVIGTPVGAIPEVIEDGVNGLLVPVSDPDALLEATLTLAGDAALRRRMGNANRRKVAEEYELNRIFERFGQVWRDCLTRGSRKTQ